MQAVSCAGRLAEICRVSRMPVPGVGISITTVVPGRPMVAGPRAVLGAMMVPGSKVPRTLVRRRPFKVFALVLLMPLVVAGAGPAVIPASLAVGPGRTRQ